VLVGLLLLLAGALLHLALWAQGEGQQEQQMMQSECCLDVAGSKQQGMWLGYGL
jgi:hypothetical protein